MNNALGRFWLSLHPAKVEVLHLVKHKFVYFKLVLCEGTQTSEKMKLYRRLEVNRFKKNASNIVQTLLFISLFGIMQKSKKKKKWAKTSVK